MNKQTGSVRQNSRPSLRLALLVVVLWAIAAGVYLLANQSGGERDFSDAERIATVLRKLEPNNVTAGLVQQILNGQRLHNFERELLAHISLALFVAGVLIIAVELQVRQLNRKEIEEYRAEVASSVWQAVSGRLIPSAVTDEIEDILRSHVVRTDARFTIRIEAAPEIEGRSSEGLLMIKRRFSYGLKNISRSSHVHNLILRLTTNIPCKGVDGKTFPRFTSLEVEGKFTPVTSENSTLVAPISLDREETKQICIDSEEIWDGTTEQTFRQFTPLVNMSLILINNAPDRTRIARVAVSHTRRALNPESQNQAEGTWTFDGALLPGHAIFLELDRIQLQSPNTRPSI